MLNYFLDTKNHVRWHGENGEASSGKETLWNGGGAQGMSKNLFQNF